MNNALTRAGSLVIFFLLSTLLLAGCGDSNGGSGNGNVYDVGLIYDVSSLQSAPRLTGLKDGMAVLGYTEGQNIRYHVTDTGNLTAEQVDKVMKEMVAKNYNAYWTIGSSTALILKSLTSRPIIAAGLSDWVISGAAQSLEKPGSNLTGVDSFSTRLTTKQLDWLTKLDQTIRTVYMIYDPTSKTQTSHLEEVRSEANRLGITLLERPVITKDEATKAISQFKASEAQAVVIIGISEFSRSGAILKSVVEREKLVLVGAGRNHIEVGALITYGSNEAALGRQSANYLDKVLHGADPAILPILSPTKLDLILNQKLATQLGRQFPAVIQGSADEVVN